MSFFRILLFAIIFISSHVSAFSQNYLNTIQIDSNDGGNQITLKTVNGVEVFKEVKNDNLVVLELKNIKADEKLSTIYNNVLHVKNVIVKEPSKNNLQIVIEGENIANTGVVVLPSAIEQFVPSKKNNIILDKPINQYEPIKSSYDNFASQNNDILEYLSANFHVNTAKLLYVKRIIKNIINSHHFDFIFYAIVFLFVIIVGNKFLNKENEKDTKIVGLSSQSLKQQKLEGYDITINDKTIPTLRSLKSNGANALTSEIISQQYGINEYKKSEKSPYKTTSPLSSKTKNITREQPITQRKKQQENITFPNSILPQKENALNNNNNNNIQIRNNINKTATYANQIDGQKFLDSMTKIYERSGRQDLAMNLKRVSRQKKS